MEGHADQSVVEKSSNDLPSFWKLFSDETNQKIQLRILHVGEQITICHAWDREESETCDNWQKMRRILTKLFRKPPQCLSESEWQRLLGINGSRMGPADRLRRLFLLVRLALSDCTTLFNLRKTPNKKLWELTSGYASLPDGTPFCLKVLTGARRNDDGNYTFLNLPDAIIMYLIWTRVTKELKNPECLTATDADVARFFERMLTAHKIKLPQPPTEDDIQSLRKRTGSWDKIFPNRSDRQKNLLELRKKA